jgi:hypothetical protein
MLHLQEVVRGPLDGLPDLMAMSRPVQKRPQDEHVKRSLQKSGPRLRLFFHGRQSTLNLASIVDIRQSIVKQDEEQAGFRARAAPLFPGNAKVLDKIPAVFYSWLWKHP